MLQECLEGTNPGCTKCYQIISKAHNYVIHNHELEIHVGVVDLHTPLQEAFIFAHTGIFIM